MTGERKQSVLFWILWINSLFPYHCLCVRLKTEGSLDNSGTFKCGASATLICTIPTYSLTMTWSVDSDIIASCFSSDCKQESPFRYGHVDFDFDTVNGIFKMIIQRINYNFSGRVIQCEDGLLAEDVTILVKVLPDQNTTRIIESVVNNTLTIEAVAGCVFPSSEIYFLWYFDWKLENSADVSEKAYLCNNGSCGGNEVIMLSSILSVQDVDTDKGDYIQVHVTYNGTDNIDPIIMNSTRRYRNKDQDVHKEDQGRSTLGIVVGVVSGLTVVIVAVALVIWFLGKRHQKAPAKSYLNVTNIGKAVKPKTNKKKKTSIEMETNVDENFLQEVDDVPNVQTERTEYYNSIEKIEDIDRINVSELFQYVIGKDVDEFAIEYQKIPTELQKPCIFARKPENIALNRYNGIFPYDHSRVKIPVLPDFFMNACYIDGFEKDKAYIASLGPTEKTTHKYVSFWQMVWHEKSDVIVMLTNLREISGMKCEQYWPDDGSITYGEISVSCLKTEIFAEYTVRSFRLSKDKEHQTVTHLHYTAWPDKTVPEDVTSLLEFRQRMIATPTTYQGPIIVHCSAGIGRTGTLIAIDRLVAEGRTRKSVDVFECVQNMREQRVKMVQTLEQYIFVYKALTHALSFDCEALSINDFPKHIDATHSSKYSRQFQQLQKTVEKDKKEENEARNRNEKQTDKNRFGADIPGDRFRVYLNLDKEDDSNYINAVYMNSFKTKDFFIIGQTPLRSTVKDFISMAYQENCICIVTMDDLNESEKTVGKYISDSKQKTYGNFNISSSILETNYQYILREMKIKYEGKNQRGEKRVYHFQYTKWLQENQTPEKAEDFVRFVKEVHQYANELGNETSHILVHCLNAYERSGLFCAVSLIMEKLQLEDRVSVTNTVRHLRTRRRYVINSKEQLLFCYQAAGAFIRLQGN